MFKKNWLLLTVLSVNTVACFHDEEARKQLFNVNTRLVSLEHDIQDKEQTNSRQYVNASGRTSQIQEDLQRLKGELDRLQIGVQKGEIPGMSGSEPSIAQQIAMINEKLKNFNADKIEERIVELEKAQKEILNLLEKLDKKKAESHTTKKQKLNSLTAIEQAFHNKHYKDIVQEAPQLLSKKGNKDANSIRYYYAESLYKVGDMREAAISFGELLKTETHGDRGAKIRLHMGDCFRKLGDKKTAIAYYKLLVEKFPKSSESQSAKEHIKKLEEPH
jgi:tetratricopeptide (TPR) repeat protein